MEILNNNLNQLNNNKSINKEIEKIEEKPQNFLETKLGQVVNNAIDFGLRAVLPNWLEKVPWNTTGRKRTLLMPHPDPFPISCNIKNSFMCVICFSPSNKYYHPIPCLPSDDFSIVAVFIICINF